MSSKASFLKILSAMAKFQAQFYHAFLNGRVMSLELLSAWATLQYEVLAIFAEDSPDEGDEIKVEYPF